MLWNCAYIKITNSSNKFLPNWKSSLCSTINRSTQRIRMLIKTQTLPPLQGINGIKKNSFRVDVHQILIKQQLSFARNWKFSLAFSLAVTEQFSSRSRLATMLQWMNETRKLLIAKKMWIELAKYLQQHHSSDMLNCNLFKWRKKMNFSVRK